MKNIKIILISVLMLLSIFLVSAVAQDGFDEWGFNFTARMFNGLLGNTDMNEDPNTYDGSDTYLLEYTDADGLHEILIDVADTHIVGKWSKGFDFDGPDEIGTWQAFHIEGTGRIYDAGKLVYVGYLSIFYRQQLEEVDGKRQYTITQFVINDQEPVVLEIPPGFGVRIPKDGEVPVPLEVEY